MTPGLAGPPFPDRACKGSVVGVAAMESPSVTLAVGECIIDVYKLTNVQGVKGKAVEMLHWAGDELWAYSVSGKGGRHPPEQISGRVEKPTIDHDMSQLDIKDDDGDGDGGVPIDDYVVVDAKPDEAGQGRDLNTEQGVSANVNEIRSQADAEPAAEAKTYSPKGTMN